ncbi:hypothetical protein [Haemophilus parainfluenzae]|uniref:hypothetical protein n=1 Tax=Haemophilus parainfluenzae TaxID=729 RepID=UPI00095A4949|nr:hypothetical protein [Haemophilus parainfluenzae]OLV27326.1 hypothetical protein BSN92_05475 [Haemophilus parainfluenzae]
MKMFKDPGNQTYVWSGFSGVLAWLGDQNNLMLLSLAIGILTALVNVYSKCAEGRMMRRENERKEEIHKVRMERLKRGLPDEVDKD